jgi:hypothetical protein
MIKNRWFFLSLLILSFSCNQKPADLSTDEVIQVINKFDKGWKNKDLNMVDSVLSPVYTYFTQSGGIFSRDSVVATAGESAYSLEEMTRSEIEVTLYENTAVVSTRWKGKGSYRGVPFDEDQRCSIIVVKNGDKVQILSEHCTPIKPNRIFH